MDYILQEACDADRNQEDELESSISLLRSQSVWNKHFLFISYNRNKMEAYKREKKKENK